MARVNILKKVKIDGVWKLLSIPRNPKGNYDWTALPEGTYLTEWYSAGKRRREAAGTTAMQALEAQRRKKHEIEGRRLGVPGFERAGEPMKRALLHVALAGYLEQVETLKKPNTYRKYKAVLKRFGDYFQHRPTVDCITVDDLNRYVVELKRRHEMEANTILHNMIIIAQFFKRHGRGGLTRDLDLPQRISPLPKEYREEDLAVFFAACDRFERALFSTFLLTGFREQEVMYLSWSDLNLRLRTIRVTAKPDVGFYPKRWEEREVPVPAQLAELLERHPRTTGGRFVFPSPTGNREQNFLLKCKAVADRAGLDSAKFDLKTYRSTYGPYSIGWAISPSKPRCGTSYRLAMYMIGWIRSRSRARPQASLPQKDPTSSKAAVQLVAESTLPNVGSAL
jgi:integrase